MTLTRPIAVCPLGKDRVKGLSIGACICYRFEYLTVRVLLLLLADSRAVLCGTPTSQTRKGAHSISLS